MKIFPVILFLCILIYSCRPDDNKSGNNDGESIYGIDITNHHGKIDWSLVKTWKGNKISFVFIKATDGKTHVDKSYLTNVKGAKNHGFLIGSCHYFSTTSSPKEQFNNFIRNVDKEKQDLLPLVNVEEMQNLDRHTFHKNFKEFLILVEKHFGKKPIIYTINSFYNKNLSGQYSGYKFMIGRYGGNEPNMRDKYDWTIWQFTENAEIKGIPKKIDIDLLNPEFELSDLLLKAPEKNKTSGATSSVDPLVIEILPYNDLSSESTNYIYTHLKAIFPNVILKDPVPLPQSAYYPARNRYRADKLIRLLSAQTTSGHVTIALTSKDISTTYGVYDDWGIMGLGYCPGKACIASTFRLSKQNTDEQFFKVAIHEFGHTQGLRHCPEKTCLMRDAKGKNTTNFVKEFCPKCKAKLAKAGWPIIVDNLKGHI